MRDAARWLGAVAAVLAALVATWAVGPTVPVPAAAGAVVAFSCVCAATVLVALVTPRFGARALAWLAVPALLLVAAASIEPGRSDLAVAVLAMAALSAGGSLAGSVIGARIQHPSHLLVAAYASSLADVYSVLSPRGVTAQVIESERWLPVLVMSWPVLGTGDIQPMLGVGDAVMCALYAVAARALGLSLRRTALALALAFAAVLVALVAFAVPLPALPFLGAAIVLAHPETRSFRPGEARIAALSLAALTAAFAVLWAL